MYISCIVIGMATKIGHGNCPHGQSLTRAEAAEHMACTVYGRQVGVRTIDRWIRLGLLERTKLGGLQWVRVDRDTLSALAARQPDLDEPAN